MAGIRQQYDQNPPYLGNMGALNPGANQRHAFGMVPYYTQHYPNAPLAAPLSGAAGPVHHQDPMANIAQGFGAMTLPNNTNSYGKRSQNAAQNNDYGNNSLPAMQRQNFAYNGAPAYGGMHHPHGNYQPVNHYAQAGPYANAYGTQAGSEAHASQNWASRIPSDGSTLPSLITPRRGSFSSMEEPVPGTPMHYATGYTNGVAIADRSPSGAYTPHNTTPSSAHFLGPQFNKQYANPPLSMKIQMLLNQDPPIPQAIPAPNSPIKPLDRCLENKMGETNVYIRGLLPETTDAMLSEWGSRFGDIASSKSIIDHKNALCKGFGFIKFYNFEDAEDCIRGFHHLGYEVSFARESFYSKLKKFSDEQNTNLYVSNIPRNFNEHELSTAFEPYKVCSARILRDDRGNGRGVGFARFETRDVCDEIIKNFNNTVVKKPGGEDHVIQIRFSDTHEQKLLKQQTAAARQFRAAEFEYGCAQALRTGVLPPQSAERLHSVIGNGVALPAVGNDFKNYLQQQPVNNSYAPVYNPVRRGPSGPTLPTIRDNGGSPVNNGKAKADDVDTKINSSPPGSAIKGSPSKLSPEV